MTVNAAMTSYPPRIGGVASVIRSLLDGTVVPDRVFLTLCSSQFPEFERSLPEDLRRLALSDSRVCLKWVEVDTKSMKKVFPILPYLRDDDLILTVDDDMKVPPDLLESRLRDFEANGSRSPITSNLSNSVNLSNTKVVTCYSLFQKGMLEGSQRLLTREVLDTGNDDRTYLYLLHLNGYSPVSCSKWCVNRGSSVQPLPVAPRSSYRYKVGTEYDQVLAPLIERLSGGRRIGQCKGLFRSDWFKAHEQRERGAQVTELREFREAVGSSTKIDQRTADLFHYGRKWAGERHDLVYVLGSGSRHDNLEIRISIASMLTHCPDWIGKIYVVGVDPHLRNEKVVHLWCPDITKSNKDANIIHKLQYAIDNVPSLTENFLFCSDDVLVTRRSVWEDFQPRVVFEYRKNETWRNELKEQSKDNKWDQCLLATLDRFVDCRDHVYFYEPHIFAPVNRSLFRTMCQQFDVVGKRSNIVMSLWFNWLNLRNPPTRFDHLQMFGKGPVDLSNPPRILTYNDLSFQSQELQHRLMELATTPRK